MDVLITLAKGLQQTQTSGLYISRDKGEVCDSKDSKSKQLVEAQAGRSAA